MKKYLMSIFIVASGIGCYAQPDLEKAVMDLSRKKFQWMINGKLDSLERVLDERMKFIHSNGWIQTKSDVIADLKSKKLVYQTIDVTESNVRVYNDMAIVLGRGKFSGSLSGNSFASDLLFTEVYVRMSNTWLLVSRQATKMQ